MAGAIPLGFYRDNFVDWGGGKTSDELHTDGFHQDRSM